MTTNPDEDPEEYLYSISKISAGLMAEVDHILRLVPELLEHVNEADEEHKQVILRYKRQLFETHARFRPRLWWISEFLCKMPYEADDVVWLAKPY